MKEYTYLKDKPGRPNAIARDFKTLEAIGLRPIIYNMSTCSYIVFDNIVEFLSWYDKTPIKTFCEVIWGERPQRLKLDIDVKDAVVESDLVDCVVEAVKLAANVLYGSIPEPIVCLSSGSDKISFHVVIPIWVSGHRQSAAFTDYVSRLLPDDYVKYVDTTVNKALQNFRIAGSHKPGTDRVKRLPAGASLESTLIMSYRDGAPACVPDIAANLRPQVVSARATPAPLIADVLARFAGITEGCEYIGELNPAGFLAQLNFKRVAPSWCQLCQRIHDKDNTLKILLSEPTNGRIAVYQGCRHFQKKLHAIGDIPTDMADIKTPLERAEEALGAQVARTTGPAPTNFDGLTNKIVYDEPTLRDFYSDAATICVRAKMKMGKTKKLREMVDRYYPSDQLIQPKIVMLSFRQTFSGNIKQAFPEFTLYSDVTGALATPRIIVQVESLHRLTPDAPPDLFIMDECESILSQFTSGLIKDFTRTWAIFRWLMQFSKKVICMDAYLSDRTFNVLRDMRPDFCNNAVFHHCTHKNATADTYNVTHDRALWFGTLFNRLDTGHRVAIPISSLTEARGLEAQLRARYPERCIKLYSSETSRVEARTHFSDVTKYWATIDILIYTPTVSAGVSFELAHFDYVFGYFVHTSCDAATAHQMIGRIRDVRTKNLIIYIAPGRSNIATTREGIVQALANPRSDLLRDFDANYLTYTIGKYGEYKIVRTDYLTLWVENTYTTNMSRAQFAKIFIEHAKDSGATCSLVNDEMLFEMDVPIADVLKIGELAIQDHKEKKTELTVVHAEAVATSAELAPDEAADIKQAISLQQDILPDKKTAYEKFKLRSQYKWTAPITAQFVLKYIAQPSRAIHRNLTRITGATNRTRELGIAPTIDNALAIIQQEERDVMSRADDTSEINLSYSFTKHRTAVGLARMCGWQSPFDILYKSPVEIHVTAGEYWRKMPQICEEYNVRLPSQQIVATLDVPSAVTAMMKPVSTILYSIYGISVICEKTVWRLKPHPAFKIVGPPGDQTVTLSPD